MNRTKAVFCASLFFPAATLASLLTGAYLKTTNPSNIDITQGLAYLGHIMLVGSLVGLAFLGAAIFFALKARKQEGAGAARLPFAIIALNIVVVIAIVLSNAYTDKVQNQYLIDHGRPTLDQYFDAVKQQKQQ